MLSLVVATVNDALAVSKSSVLTAQLSLYHNQVSSIFLNLVRYKHLTPFWSAMNQLCFAVTFFIFRIVIVPYIWVAQGTLL